MNKKSAPQQKEIPDIIRQYETAVKNTMLKRSVGISAITLGVLNAAVGYDWFKGDPLNTQSIQGIQDQAQQLNQTLEILSTKAINLLIGFIGGGVLSYAALKHPIKKFNVFSFSENYIKSPKTIDAKIALRKNKNRFVGLKAEMNNRQLTKRQQNMLALGYLALHPPQSIKEVKLLKETLRSKNAQLVAEQYICDQMGYTLAEEIVNTRKNAFFDQPDKFIARALTKSIRDYLDEKWRKKVILGNRINDVIYSLQEEYSFRQHLRPAWVAEMVHDCTYDKENNIIRPKNIEKQFAETTNETIAKIYTLAKKSNFHNDRSILSAFSHLYDITNDPQYLEYAYGLMDKHVFFDDYDNIAKKAYQTTHGYLRIGMNELNQKIPRDMVH